MYWGDIGPHERVGFRFASLCYKILYCTVCSHPNSNLLSPYMRASFFPQTQIFYFKMKDLDSRIPDIPSSYRTTVIPAWNLKESRLWASEQLNPVCPAVPPCPRGTRRSEPRACSAVRPRAGRPLRMGLWWPKGTTGRLVELVVRLESRRPSDPPV